MAVVGGLVGATVLVRAKTHTWCPAGEGGRGQCMYPRCPLAVAGSPAFPVWRVWASGSGSGAVPCCAVLCYGGGSGGEAVAHLA